MPAWMTRAADDNCNSGKGPTVFFFFFFFVSFLFLRLPVVPVRRRASSSVVAPRQSRVARDGCTTGPRANAVGLRRAGVRPRAPPPTTARTTPALWSRWDARRDSSRATRSFDPRTRAAVFLGSRPFFCFFFFVAPRGRPRHDVHVLGSTPAPTTPRAVRADDTTPGTLLLRSRLGVAPRPRRVRTPPDADVARRRRRGAQRLVLGRDAPRGCPRG